MVKRKDMVNHNYHKYDECKRDHQSRNAEDSRSKEVHHHYYYEPPRQGRERSSKPGIAGALLIITAVLGLAFGSALVVGSMIFADFDDFIKSFDPNTEIDIYGQVTLVDGTPVENANISIIDTDLYAQTDGNGSYILYNVPIGNQEIMVEKDGYSTIIQKVFLSSDGNQDYSGINTDTNDETKSTAKKYNFVLRPGDDVINKGSFMPFEWIGSILIVCSVIVIILSMITLIAGYFALKRTKLPLVITGAVLGIITIGFMLGTILAIIALFIILLSKNEFS
jgi:hypothetical protein